MKLETAIKFLKAEYEKAQLLKFVNNPLAYALYQVWKMADRGDNTDKKLTANEIVKALECYSCMEEGLHEQALDLINRQKAENERLQKQLNNAEDLVAEKTVAITDLLGEIERLKGLLEEWKTQAYKIADEKDELIKENRILFAEVKTEVDNRCKAQAEAVKEFAERLTDTYNFVTSEEINSLLKEMTKG